MKRARQPILVPERHPDAEVILSRPEHRVDLLTGLTHVVAALDAFSERNKRRGFDTGSNVPQHSGPIWGMYRHETASVQQGAQENADALLYVAKRNFWRATGFAAIRGTNLMKPYVVNAHARHMWRTFEQTYSGTKQEAELRRQYRSKLIDQATEVAISQRVSFERIDVMKEVAELRQSQALHGASHH